MKKELDEQLCKDFPLTFRDRHDSMMNTSMCWGFTHGDGWEKIIRKACEKIEPRIQQLIDEGKENEGVQFKAAQCKEKFGTLRFYFTFSDKEIDAAIGEAENASENTCEECGEPGKLRGANRGWYYTACDDCHDEHLERKARDNLFYGVLGELRKHGNTDAIATLEAWREAKKAKEDEQDD